MKILHLNSFDITGGAARAAYRQHLALLRVGQDSSMLVYDKRGDDPEIVRYEPPKSLHNRLHRRLRRDRIYSSFAKFKDSLSPSFEIFSDDRSCYGSELLRQLPESDVINLHWVAGFLDYKTFFTGLPAHLPVVWTLHDMNVFTGGCHYDNSCPRFVDHCGACPQLGSNCEEDLSHHVWRRKSAAFAARHNQSLKIVANSYWLEGEARRSSLLRKFDITTIHYGIDVESFKPRDRAHARAVLGIPQDASVLMFAAASVVNQRKGLAYLIESLAGLENNVPNLYLLTVGHHRPAMDKSVQHQHIRHVDDDRLLSLIYSAADIFIIPSLQEAFGQTALESMACGTPVIGFASGGITDMVRDNVTGALVNTGDVMSLRSAIAAMFNSPLKLAEMSANCRRVAVEEFSLEICGNKYVSLYESML